ncbi:DUF2157 domain-containing protein [Halomonas sp. QX-2]|jgi:uncharacterized membrane protein|uniref:DUF2157 domain-containing protein n=1 Tax=Vreelandella sedimenti TaxID=2729618 RepID=A0A7Z0N8V1_9GAMM|nr:MULTISPECIES: DUF2157 domain-containing protein [Halomonas]NYT73309.1 DUF2157 domain-containing protein [Halomonas sedimenti]|tara:strand:- start:23117 stop:24088 length:972 start_codon:yes stop_codon:yes gene_type:complete
MASTRRELISLIEQGVIPPEQVTRAVQASGLHPSPRAWALFIDRLLLWLGGLALAFAVLFFVAYNWAEMGRWLRFGVVQAAVVLAVGIAIWPKVSPMVQRVALTSATLLVGVLLALFGQVYQSGADPWQLFFTWALLALPWAWVARFELLWVLWLGLLNLAVGLYFRTWGGPFGVLVSSDAALWGLFGLNTLALIIWESGARYRGWPRQLALRLLAVSSGVPMTLLAVTVIADVGLVWSPVLAIYPLWLVALYGIYRYWRPELFMIAGGCVSALTVITLLLARLLLWEGDWQEGSLLLITIAVLAMGAGAVVWLKRLHREISQ